MLSDCSKQNEVGGKVDVSDCFLDLIFLMDSSSSVSDAKWLLQLEFAAKLVQRFDVGIDKTRIGFVAFGTK